MRRLQHPRPTGAIKLAVMSFVAACAACTAQAGQINGPEDWVINLDNTLQYSMGWRAQAMDPRIGNGTVFQQGDYKFPKRGDMVTNRIQDLIEFQGVYKGKAGFRTSASVWKDFAYNDKSYQNPAYAAAGIPNSYPNGVYTNYTKRYFLRGGEILDAFVFANTEVADKPVYLKAGKLTQYWGNALFFPFSNNAYSQAPLDYIKAFSQPGSEVKELFMPRKQVLLSTDLTPELSVSAEYFFDHVPNRYPEASTYFGFYDILFDGPPTGGVTGLLNDGLVKPPNRDHDWGFKANWSPEWAGGDMGFYLRQFDEVHPWLALINPTTGHIQNTFARKTKLIGFSYEKTFGLVSTGFEINRRLHTALYSAGFAPTNQGASGDITNVIGNTLIQLGKGPLWDSGILLGEFSFTHLDKVTQNGYQQYYNNIGSPHCVNSKGGPGTWRDGCATRNALALAVLFDPQWLQVFPGIDFDMPISYTIGVKGNPAYAAGTFYQQGTNIYSIGIKGTYQSKTSLSLTYNGYRWRSGDSAPNFLGLPAFTSGSGAYSLNDRGWVQLQLKTSF